MVTSNGHFTVTSRTLAHSVRKPSTLQQFNPQIELQIIVSRDTLAGSTLRGVGGNYFMPFIQCVQKYRPKL